MINGLKYARGQPLHFIFDWYEKKKNTYTLDDSDMYAWLSAQTGMYAVACSFDHPSNLRSRK